MPYTHEETQEMEGSPNANTTKLDKNSLPKEEYVKKRERNNIAVRKSRRKAKEKIEETKQRVNALSKENEDLRNKVALLQKELNVLRSLFANGEVSNNIPNGVNVVFTNSPGQCPNIVVKTEVPDEEDCS
ncbi:CCAAT/enhancer-binding protein gamma-like [Actinia tenebrosa]|uniref:CCAAT/enhancer-binding protein gamma-like n=1 Tax=Actinia tenebrosa TaxID=6105 RepID=A0A6P8HVI1_ACTTE|nr:CCAAT/enhancer-binding protein gamma-like [Actinia tenebrosa]